MQRNKSVKSSSYQTRTKVYLVFVLIISLLIFAAVTSYVLLNYFHLKTESSYIIKNEFQAVYVNQVGTNGSQTYFGHIKSINSKYIVLNDVFFLQPGKSQNQLILVNLSCEVYAPEDQLIINRSQVSYWQNIQSSSQVGQQINTWNSENLNCPTQQN